jgi:hypothetical protein
MLEFVLNSECSHGPIVLQGASRLHVVAGNREALRTAMIASRVCRCAKWTTCRKNGPLPLGLRRAAQGGGRMLRTGRGSAPADQSS